MHKKCSTICTKEAYLRDDSVALMLQHYKYKECLSNPPHLFSRPCNLFEWDISNLDKAKSGSWGPSQSGALRTLAYGSIAEARSILNLNLSLDMERASTFSSYEASGKNPSHLTFLEFDNPRCVEGFYILG